MLTNIYLPSGVARVVKTVANINFFTGKNKYDIRAHYRKERKKIYKKKKKR